MSEKSTIYDFLKGSKYMTLCTSSKDGKPEAATVEYVVDGDDLLINTFVYYRKYDNLLQNPLVACVVTTDNTRTLQIDGRVAELTGDQADSVKQKMLVAEPSYESFYNDKDTKFFRISPTWMRLRDYTKDPMEVVEHVVASAH